MPAHPVTHVIVPSYPLTDFLFEQMHGLDDVRIIRHPMPHRSPLSTLLRGLEVYALAWWKGSRYFDRAYIGQLERIRPEDNVLFFAIENRKDLQIVRKFISARRQSVWLWNPVDEFRGHALSRWWYRRWIGRCGLQAYTFNPADARENGIRLAHQVYRHVEPVAAENAGEAPRHDVYFLGIDKGRLTALQSLKADFERAGLKVNLLVVPDKRKHYSDADRAQLTTGWVPYQDNLRTVRASRALLELLQSNQSGPTIRSMEAAFLNKKLITNNLLLRETALYHPSRVFILGVDDLADIKAFIDRPMEPLPPATLRQHDIRHWLSQFGD